MDSIRRILHDRRWLVLLVGMAATIAADGRAAAADAQSLAGQVTIRRTEYGIPHIQGESLEALAFGFGYCQAEDHWPNILRGIVGVRGELAATFGTDAEDPGDRKNTESDFRTRRYRIYARAVENQHKLDPDYRSMVEGFAAGLNYYVARHRTDLPAWVPEVRPHDVTAYGLAGVMRFAFDRGGLIRNFLRTRGVETAMLDRDFPKSDMAAEDAELGSNMWALAPSRSRSGRAMLMGNPHQAWAPVSTYYEAHLIVPGQLNFYGATFIGRPIVTTGWNEHLGWSHTVNNPDLEEIYELTLDPDRADHYLFDGGSVPLEAERVTVEIKTGAGPTFESRTYWHSPLGPVIHRTDKHVYVLRSACYENFRAYEQWLRMTQATSYEEFRGVLEMGQIPMFNICYADRAGNISFLWNGTVPVMPHAAHRAEAVPAARSADIWTRFHALDELPQLFNPPAGYVQNCNSPPYLTNLAARLDRSSYPAHFPANNLSLRTQHSLALVDNDRKLALEDVVELKHSPRMLAAERFKDDLIAVLRDSQPTSEVSAAIKILVDWDNTVAADSRGGALFDNWWERYYDRGKGKLSVEWSEEEPTATPRGLADHQRAVKSFVEALDEVTRRYGRADVAWGEAHRIRKGAVDLPVSGGSGWAGCFRVLGFRADADGRQVARTGDSWVFAVEFSQPPKAYTVVAYSQSELENSPHYADQAPLFSAGKMKRAAFTDAEIEAQLIREYRPGEE